MEKSLTCYPGASSWCGSWDWIGNREELWKTKCHGACNLRYSTWTGRREKAPRDAKLSFTKWRLNLPARCSTDEPKGGSRFWNETFISGVVGEQVAYHICVDDELESAATDEEPSAGSGTPSTDSFKKFLQGSNRMVGGHEVKLHYLEERDEGLLSKRLVSLSRSNKLTSALELYFSMELSCLKPDPHACNSLLSCILRNGSLNDALKIFEAMRESDLVSGHSYTMILKEVARTRGFDTALDMFVGMEKEGVSKGNIDVVVYNTMISICAKRRNWNEAEKLWRKLKENGFNGTKLTYSLLISTFVQCSQTELALAAYGEMLQEGIKPGEDDMKAMIAACTKEGNWSAATNVLQQMLNDGIKPDFIALNALINCLGKAGEAALAFKVFDLMKSFGHAPDSYTWNALLSALYRNKLYADCIQLFERVNGMENFDMNIHLYNTALMSCQKLRLWDRALQLVWQMEQKGIQVPTESYNLVIGACEKAKRPKVALQVFDHMVHKNCVPDTFTYLSLLRACIWGSLWNEVDYIIEHAEPNSSFYNALIQGLCLKGNITVAKRLYGKMRCIGLITDGKTRALMLQHMNKDRVRTQRRRK